MRRIVRLVFAPAVLATAGACFATQSDMITLQGNLQAMRTEQLTADSALRAHLAQGFAQLASSMTVVEDSLRALSAQVMRLRGDVREDTRAIRQQLITIQELTGQSQRRINELRSELEQRAAVPAQVSPQPPADRGAAAAQPTQPTQPPGPAQLYQLGQDQLRRGSVSSARAAYAQLLERYPTSDLAPNALYGIAETWADEGNAVAADSVYAAVVERYPRSDVAPNALYKRASAYRVIGRTEQALALYRRIVEQYPRSDAALLAQEFLRTQRQP
jgi:tol-pal system protein YbgF